MLSNNNHNSSCDFSAEIVSYLYNESSEAARGKFESHLAGCGVCTDEFAAVSNARFLVFEWQKEEFAHLPTPEIVIPYAARQTESEAVAKVSLLSGLRGLLSVLSSPSTVTAVAALTVCLGLGFLAMTYVGRGDQQIANVSPHSVPLDVSKDDPVKVESPDIPDDQRTTRVGVTTLVNNKTRPVKAVEYRRARPGRQMTAGTQQSVKNVKAPVLSSYDDNDDKSLRLADLFDEIGGGL